VCPGFLVQDPSPSFPVPGSSLEIVLYELSPALPLVPLSFFLSSSLSRTSLRLSGFDISLFALADLSLIIPPRCVGSLFLQCLSPSEIFMRTSILSEANLILAPLTLVFYRMSRGLQR